MKTSSDNLFKLIKSLTKDEKRCFKAFAGREQESTSYLQLFEVLDKQKHYSEEKTLLFLNKKGGINNLSYVKNYLTESILTFLEQHHHDFSAEIQLQNLVKRAEILYEKALFKAAMKCIEKAEKTAKEYHQYLYLLTILSWKRKLWTVDPDLRTLDEDSDFRKELEYLDLYKNVLEYEKLYRSTFSILARKTENVDEKETAELNKMLKNPFLRDEAMALSYPAKAIYFRTLGEIHILLKNLEMAYACFQRVTAYFEPAKLSPSVRLVVFSRQMILVTLLKKRDEMLSVKNAAVNFFNSLPKKLQTRRLCLVYSALMDNYTIAHILAGNISEALSASDEMQELAEKNVNTQNFIVYYANRVSIYFLLPDYRKALRYANKVLSVENTGIRQDVVFFVKILAIITHYELGHEDLLPSLCQSCSRYFERQKQQHKTDHILLDFFTKTIYKQSNRHDRTNAFLALKKELKWCKTGSVFDYFYLNWADSKIQNRPMVDMLKEKSLKS